MTVIPMIPLIGYVLTIVGANWAIAAGTRDSWTRCPERTDGDGGRLMTVLPRSWLFGDMTVSYTVSAAPTLPVPTPASAPESATSEEGLSPEDRPSPPDRRAGLLIHPTPRALSTARTHEEAARS